MRRIKQRDIARQVGCSEPYVSEIIHRKRTPSPELARAMEKATGVNRLAWLYPDEYLNPYMKQDRR